DPFANALHGPRSVDLGHDVTIDLPDGFVLFEKDKAREIMEKMGNLRRNDLLALVTKPESDWLVTISYDDDGYVKDDDAEKLDGNELLASTRRGTAAANEERQKRGVPPIEVVGWDEPPAYERTEHHLVWAVRGRSESHDVVNFNTRVLGRRGYV